MTISFASVIVFFRQDHTIGVGSVSKVVWSGEVKQADVCRVGSRLNTTVQSQKAVSAYFTSKQILPFGIAEQNTTKARSIKTQEYHEKATLNVHLWFADSVFFLWFDTG